MHRTTAWNWSASDPSLLWLEQSPEVTMNRINVRNKYAKHLILKSETKSEQRYYRGCFSVCQVFFIFQCYTNLLHHIYLQFLKTANVILHHCKISLCFVICKARLIIKNGSSFKYRSHRTMECINPNKHNWNCYKLNNYQLTCELLSILKLKLRNV